MCCHRCQGLMLPEEAGDWCERFTLYACICCGNRLDAVIVQNRRQPQEITGKGIIRHTGVRV